MCSKDRSHDKSERNKVAEKQAADTRDPKKTSTDDKKRPSIIGVFENNDQTNILDNKQYSYQQRQQLNHSKSLPMVQLDGEQYDIDTALDIAELIVVNHQQQQTQLPIEFGMDSSTQPLPTINEHDHEYGSPPENPQNLENYLNHPHPTFITGDQDCDPEISPDNSPNMIGPSPLLNSSHFTNINQFDFNISNSKSNMPSDPTRSKKQSKNIYDKIQARKAIEQKAIQQSKERLLVVEDRQFVRVSTSPNFHNLGLNSGQEVEVGMIDLTPKPLAETMRMANSGLYESADTAREVRERSTVFGSTTSMIEEFKLKINHKSVTDQNYNPDRTEYKRVQTSVNNHLQRLQQPLNILVIGNSESGKTSLIDALESVVSGKRSKRQTTDEGLPLDEGRRYKLTERIVYQNKNVPTQNYDNFSIAYDNQVNSCKIPGVAFWDTRGLETIGNFDHASNIVRMVLEGRIEPHQFQLALMFRAVPSKASKLEEDGKKRLHNVFKDTTRRFHAIILCCDSTKDPPIRLAEILFDALHKSALYSVNRIPILTVLTHCDVHEKIDLNSIRKRKESDASENGSMSTSLLASAEGLNQIYADQKNSETGRKTPNSSSRKNSLIPQPENGLEFKPSRTQTLSDSKDPANCPPDAKCEFKELTAEQVYTRLYLERLAQLYDPEALMLLASLSDHKDLEKYDEEDEKERYRVLHDFFEENREKLKPSKNSAASIAIEKFPSFSGNHQNSSNSPDASMYLNQDYNGSESKNNSESPPRVIRVDAGKNMDESSGDILKQKYNYLLAWVNILKIVQPHMKPMARKPLSKTCSFDDRKIFDPNSESFTAPKSMPNRGSLRSLLKRQGSYTEVEPEPASRERNQTWTAGYAQKNDIRQAVRMAKKSSQQITDPSCASPLRPPVTPDAFGLLKNMKNLVLGKSSSKSQSSSKPKKYSKHNATQQLKIILNNESSSKKSPQPKTPNNDKFQDKNDKKDKHDKNDKNDKPDQPDYTNFPRL